MLEDWKVVEGGIGIKEKVWEDIISEMVYVVLNGLKR